MMATNLPTINNTSRSSKYKNGEVKLIRLQNPVSLKELRKAISLYNRGKDENALIEYLPNPNISFSLTSSKFSVNSLLLTTGKKLEERNSRMEETENTRDIDELKLAFRAEAEKNEDIIVANIVDGIIVKLNGNKL